MTKSETSSPSIRSSSGDSINVGSVQQANKNQRNVITFFAHTIRRIIMGVSLLLSPSQEKIIKLFVLRFKDSLLKNMSSASLVQDQESNDSQKAKDISMDFVGVVLKSSIMKYVKEKSLGSTHSGLQIDRRKLTTLGWELGAQTRQVYRLLDRYGEYDKVKTQDLAQMPAQFYSLINKQLDTLFLDSKCKNQLKSAIFAALTMENVSPVNIESTNHSTNAPESGAMKLKYEHGADIFGDYKALFSNDIHLVYFINDVQHAYIHIARFPDALKELLGVCRNILKKDYQAPGYSLQQQIDAKQIVTHYDNVCAISKQVTSKLELALQKQVNIFIESQKSQNSIDKTDPQQENIPINPMLEIVNRIILTQHKALKYQYSRMETLMSNINGANSLHIVKKGIAKSKSAILKIDQYIEKINWYMGSLTTDTKST